MIQRFVAWWVPVTVDVCTVVVDFQNRGCFSSFADNIGMV